MKRWLPAILILALLIAFRVMGSAMAERFPNFQPLPTLFLCAWIFLKGVQRWLVPLLAWLVTDPITSLFQGYSIWGWHHLSLLLGVLAIVALAQWARRRPRALPVLMASVVAALVFHFLSNLVAFVVDPLYAKTVEGFVQSQWTGPAGMVPTWVFLRNLVAANVLFTGLFLLARQSLPKTVVAPTPALAR